MGTLSRAATLHTARVRGQLPSALVTELTPIILALRHVEYVPFLVLEDPEAHVHPRIQRLLAQTIVRLVRKDTTGAA